MSAPLTRRAALFGAMKASAAVAAGVLTTCAPPVAAAGYDITQHEPTPGNPYTMETFALVRFGVLAERHRRAEVAYLAACVPEDTSAMDAAYDEAEAALMAICSYLPCSHHDERARADYLAAFSCGSKTTGYDLERHHVAALLGSTGRYEDTFRVRAA